MIVFYDIMLVDEKAVMNLPYSERRWWLTRVVTSISGRADINPYQTLDFSISSGLNDLQEALAAAFAKEWEGIVLKTLDEPFLNLKPQACGSYPCCRIKLKKDYIAGLGDTADLAIVGAGYKASDSAKLHNSRLRWTHFFIGCLRNKREVIERSDTPHFQLVGVVSRGCISLPNLQTLNDFGQFQAISASAPQLSEYMALSGSCDGPPVLVAFKQPFVVEVMGSGFDKNPNCGYFMIRFPRILKIHQDRTYEDTASLDELQEMAAMARSTLSEDESQDFNSWMARLEIAERGIKNKRLPWDDSQDLESGLDDVMAAPAINTSDMIRADIPSTQGSAGHSMPSQQQVAPLTTTAGLEATSEPMIPSSRKRTAESSDDLRNRLAQKKVKISERSTPNRTSPGASRKSSWQLARQPLGEIFNSATLPRAPTLQKLEQTQWQPRNSLELVPQLEEGSKKHRTIKQKRPYPKSVASTNSPCTTIGSWASQSTNASGLVNEEGHTSAAESVVSGLQPHNMLESARAKIVSKTDVPDFSRCQVILSPCLVGHPQLSQALGQLEIQAKPLQINTAPALDGLWRRDCLGRDIVLLVEPKHAHATLTVLQSLVILVASLKNANVSVWDWRLVGKLSAGFPTGNDEHGKLQKYYYAIMELEEGTDMVQVEWRGGVTTSVPLQNHMPKQE